MSSTKATPRQHRAKACKKPAQEKEGELAWQEGLGAGCGVRNVLAGVFVPLGSLLSALSTAHRFVIRKRIKLPPESAMFLFIKDNLPQKASLMSTVYEEEKDEDGFLYITYSGENTFGALFEALAPFEVAE